MARVGLSIVCASNEELEEEKEKEGLKVSAPWLIWAFVQLLA
jgi:hypothetical protein